jgi:YggT family protein
MNLNPFVELAVTVISLYTWAVIIFFILDILASFQIINSQQIFVYRVMNFLGQLINPVINKIKKIMPTSVGGIDLAPLILLLGLGLVKSILINYFFTF